MSAEIIIGEIIGAFDGGVAEIKHNGQPLKVGVIILKAMLNDQPIIYEGRYRLNYQESIIKTFKRIAWVKSEPPALAAADPETPAPSASIDKNMKSPE